MKIIVTIQNESGGKPWTEEWNTGDEAPQEYADRIIDYFNRTLRPGYEPRKLIGWDAGEHDVELQHNWIKTSLVTEVGGYDKMRCQRCGATGKRHGLGRDGVMVDGRRKNKDICQP